MTPVVIVPIRSFAGMARLAPVLDAPAREDLARRLAAGVLDAAAEAGSDVVVVTGDPTVASFAAARTAAVVDDPGEGLDAAASAAVSRCKDRRWVVLHADLPLLTAADVTAVLAAAGDGVALAPSKDGGTSAVAASMDRFPFHYGVGSFHRHLAAVGGRATVVVRPGLAVDIDRPADLAVMAGTGPP